MAILDYTDLNNYEYVLMQPTAKGLGVISMITRIAGVETTVATQAVTWAVGVDHTAKIERSGTHLRMYIDGILTDDTTPALPPNTGAIAIAATGDGSASTAAHFTAAMAYKSPCAS